MGSLSQVSLAGAAVCGRAPPSPLRLHWLRGSRPHRVVCRNGPDIEPEKKKAEEPPWTFSQLISLLSGIIGTLLSVTAFSKQREPAKGRLSIAAARQGAVSKAVAGGARIVQQLGGSLLEAEADSPLFSLGPLPQCTPASDLRRPGRHFTIITTAALPWRTGTAVNPLLRALYLAKSGRPVVFVVPWIDEEDQKNLFPAGQVFREPSEQEEEIRVWCRDRAKIDPAKLPLTFRWYQARYHKNVRSIFPKGDCSKELGPDDPRDVLILEEPEHLCWYHHGECWPSLFNHVIGIVHTNYQDYLIQTTINWSANLLPEQFKEASIFAASTLVCSAYCDVNIKLSDTIMPLPNEVTCNVHGVRAEFLSIGDSLRPPPPGTAPAYYLGKAIYEKGWGELLAFLEEAGGELKDLRIDGYGSGPDYDNIVRRAEALKETGATFTMHPGLDHAEEVIHGHGVLVNPSTSDVLCTVTVEALAMGKHCVLARHPSNRFFEEHFPSRCHFFQVGDGQGFVQALKEAVAAGPPAPLPKDEREVLTWEAASERLFDSAEVRVISGPYQRPSEAAASRLAYRLHFDTMKDKGMVASIIREATLGEKTPWDKYFAEWAGLRLEEAEKEEKKQLTA